MAQKLAVSCEELEALGGKGYSVTMICEAVGITRQAAYKNKYIIDSIKRGHTQARQKVIDDLMGRSVADTSSTASIYLSKQLKCFDDHFPTASPKSPADALRKISDIYMAVSHNELTQERGNYLAGFLEKYIKAFEITEIAQRLDAVEAEIKKQSNGRKRR